MPVFAHIPMILGSDKSRLSKRHGASSLQAFREAGILPEAMLNYLARLGWSHGDQEIFSREDLVAHFDLSQVGRAGAVFDRTKLEWLSHHWIKAIPAERVAADLGPFLERAGIKPPADRRWLARIVETLRERSRTLQEMAEHATFYFRRPTRFDPQATARYWTGHARERYALLITRLERQEDMAPEALEMLFRGLAAEMDLPLLEVAQLARIAITGKTASPPIFEVVSILGKAETLARLKATLAAMESAR